MINIQAACATEGMVDNLQVNSYNLFATLLSDSHEGALVAALDYQSCSLLYFEHALHVRVRKANRPARIR